MAHRYAQVCILPPGIPGVTSWPKCIAHQCPSPPALFLRLPRSRTHARACTWFIVRTHFASPASSQPAARVSVVCNPPLGLIPLNRPHSPIVGAASAILVPPTPHAQVHHPSRGIIHVRSYTYTHERGCHELASTRARLCQWTHACRCARSRAWKGAGSRVEPLEGRYRGDGRWWFVVGRRGTTGVKRRRAYFRIQRTTRRREEEEAVEEEEEEKEVSFRGTSRVGNRLNFCHPLRHISLLGHLPPLPLLVAPLHPPGHPLVAASRTLGPARYTFLARYGVTSSWWSSLKRDSKDSRVCWLFLPLISREARQRESFHGIVGRFS